MPVAQTRLEILQICKLLQCVREQDKVQIKKLVDSGVPHLINYNEPTEGETALTIAAVQNNEDMIEFLLEIGAHPNVVDLKGRTAAMRAAEYGHVQCLEMLAKGKEDVKADMTITDLEGKGILFFCLSESQRHDRCADIILNHGANVDNKSNEGYPIFVHACETANENERLCLKLLERGADPNLKFERLNRTSLMAACKSGSTAVVKEILRKGGKVNEIMNKPKYHAAHEAARGGFIECLQALSSYGAKFDYYDEFGNNPIHLAALNGHAMCVKFLSQRGCNPKPKNKEGLPPKGIAKERGHKAAGKECRKAEKSFGKTGKNNEPWVLTLYDFCYERKDKILEAFQKYDPDALRTVTTADFLDCLETIGAPLPDEADMKKITMAHEVNKGNMAYEDFLTGKKYVNKQYLMTAFEGKKKKKKGGKGGKKKKGKTKIPMEICTQADGVRAEDGGPPEVFVPRHIHYTDVNRFNRDGPPEHPLQDDSGWYLNRPEKNYVNVNEAAKHADLHTLQDAFERGVSVDIRDKYFKTPLMIACVNGNIDVVKYLVERGANVNAQDNFKWAPLHFACHAGMKDIVEYLLEHGSSLEATTLNGATPLMRAIESSKAEVVTYLLDHGAKLRVENRKGQSPLDIAIAWADFRVYDIVKVKWDALPPLNDKNKKGKPAAKKPKTPKGDQEQPPPTAATAKEGEEEPEKRKGSILRAASALIEGIEEQEDITFRPIKVWTKQKTTQELIHQREVNRDRFGWEVDFSDFKMPLLHNVDQKIIEMGGPDAD